MIYFELTSVRGLICCWIKYFLNGIVYFIWIWLELIYFLVVGKIDILKISAKRNWFFVNFIFGWCHGVCMLFLGSSFLWRCPLEVYPIQILHILLYKTVLETIHYVKQRKKYNIREKQEKSLLILCHLHTQLSSGLITAIILQYTCFLM